MWTVKIMHNGVSRARGSIENWTRAILHYILAKSLSTFCPCSGIVSESEFGVIIYSAQETKVMTTQRSGCSMVVADCSWSG